MQDGPVGPPRVVWHTTEAPPGVPAMFGRMRDVLTKKSAEPHILIDPVTDRCGQFLPFGVSGRALRNAGDVRNNRVGPACIQIEVIAYAETPFTDYWQPGPNWLALMAAIRSWDIPDVFPAGPPPRWVPGRGNTPQDPRSLTVWLSRGGHYGHSQVTGNDHGDPGGIDTEALLALRPQEDDMPLTPDDVRKISTEAVFPLPGDAWQDPTKRWALATYLRATFDQAAAARRDAAKALAIVEAFAANGGPLSAAQIEEAVRKALADSLVSVDVNVTGGEAA